ncbi:MAG: LytTR family DNA-binding domain-containing protein [Saprospiraceae bacterium]
MIKTIIVDDEPLALDILESYISQLDQMHLVARCANAMEANRVLQNEQVELMFLDIEMPSLKGTDFLRSIAHPPAVIFTTAYPEFAVQGFELNALDYLLKPVSFERFVRSVNKYSSAHQITKIQSVNNQDFIFVKSDKKFVKLNFDEIIYIEGLKDYVIIYTPQSRIITLQTMKSLDEKLPKDIFLRAHRSFIVNFDQISAVQGNNIEVMIKGQSRVIPIGNNYKDEIETMIEKKKL